ncbi:chromosome-associated kinesin KIF4 isoform X2 [Pieris rapae]|uniref:chromosome-associated kinesin KIF4 isoform X2 n=1 Tax=Pieris rapae TaxID=64459 RepID=UPI001E2802D2|nr:chromosome-associated kinesin KIF4 isoform X2 [Pieris rapae]
MVDEHSNKCSIDAVQVALRIRPLLAQEIERGCVECIEMINGTPQVIIKDLAFTYNFVFPQHITQQEFYDTSVKALITKLFQGYNVTILAYGQTGSGKTFTIGTNYSGSFRDSTKLGVIPQAVADIFDFIEKNEDQFIFKVSVSFMELYQEQCFDLLSGKKRGHSIIEIREDFKGVILPGITEVPVSSMAETMLVLERGASGRMTGPTAMNQASSRSHAVFTITILKESRTDKNLVTSSKFHLVDLAGSERIKKTKASGERLKEGVKINQGLLALGNVISALGNGTNKSFISYRDSKLTRLLQDSLGGNSLTLMVACVSPADFNFDETLSTLRYADRARRIRNKPVINQDAKAAENVRLTNLVNDLKLQLLDKLPSPSDKSKEQLQEELDREIAKSQVLLNKNKQITEHLGNIFIENTNLCEKVLLAEAANNKIEGKLNELTEHCNQIIENVTMDKEEDDSQKTSLMDYLKEIKTRLEDMQTLKKHINEEMIDHDIKVSYMLRENGDNGHNSDNGVEEVMTEDQAAIEGEKRAMGQVALNQELQELNREMAFKAALVQSILRKNQDILKSHDNLSINEDKIAKLEKEKDELLQQLKNTQTKDLSHDENRKQVSMLESEITELRKKCQHQANVIETTQKNESHIKSLNDELQAMDAAKVEIIRKMREECEKYRKWKADNERAMLRLKADDRKLVSAMAKMESLHAKQQNVLKRKMEEVVAVNKRLKEALDRQKLAVKQNGKENVNVNRGAVPKCNNDNKTREDIERELEMHLSIVEAEKSLDELMEYRALITRQIEIVRNCTDSEANRKKLHELEDDLALRNAQISDLQQKIITADQENDALNRWDKIQSMPEAKAALKCLFELLVEAKKDLQSQTEKGFQAKYEEIKNSYDRLKVEYENREAEFERKLAGIKAEHDEKLSILFEFQRKVICRGDETEPCRNLQTALQVQQDKLELLDQQHKKLYDELDKLRATNAQPGKAKKSNKALEKVKKKEYVEPTDEDEEDEEFDNDPDWGATPHSRRCQRRYVKKKFSAAEDCISYAIARRRSETLPYCICRGSCSSNLCGCVKTDRSCHSKCRCSQQYCKNRRLSSDGHDKENNRSERE